MPKLLQINVSVNYGSTGRLTEDLGDVAIKNGWESYIAYGRSMMPSHSHLIKIGNRWDVFTHVIYTRLFDRHGFGSREATKRLIERLDEINPDIIQFQNIHGYYLNLPVITSYVAKRDIPVVWSLHDCWGMTGHCSHFALCGCDKWKTGCYDCPLKKSYPESLLLDSSRRNYLEKKRLFNSIPRLTIIAGSEWIADIARNSYLYNRDIRVIPFGVDTEVFRPYAHTAELRKRYGLDNKFVIMAAGTVWLPYKGTKDYGYLREKLSDDYAIMLVGISPKDVHSLPKGIIGIPKTSSPKELAELYSVADCVMSLSRLESFGLTPVEGFACGTPAIVYDNVALSELITSETGFKVQVGDIDGLKERVAEMRSLGKNHFAKNCRKIALEKYDKYKCFGEYMRVYQSILGI